ncbi:magnesium and cobalt transport protein CorA [Rhodoferax sp. AJA081-3]|uniref:magnesium and cobalt transport protein CorA n=1 Tax=Rhodoferax sp. AJA081-3 TaxID=2752316 RepID=UPI001ADF946D|nr:magnesium and cobalt transport protein CorA [Rhodoferax sp. AJA081-3]QTN26221.1 magnesium and cobalt transport protein CorA [Rhodoferax sp. AJA081-3]
MLINCVVYQHGTKLADIPVSEISDYIAKPDTFVWVALQDATPEELEEMREEFALHELAVEDARHGHQRPKVEEYGASLFTVLHLIEPLVVPDKPSELNIGEVNIFTGSNYVLSVRNRSQQGFLGVRARCEREPELLRHGSGFVLYALMDSVVDRYFPIIDGFETELELIEKDIFTKKMARSNIERLYELKGRVMVLKHAVAPLLEGTSKLSGGRVPSICLGVQDYFRDVMDHLSRINSLIDTMRDTIGTAIQVNLAMATIEENEVTKRLAAWASIFAIWTALAGVWGMNFENMPELKWKYGYAMALGVMAVACSFLYWKFKRARWL